MISRDDLFEQLSSGAKWNAGVSFHRTNPLPIDDSSIFKSLEEAQAYAKTATAYPTQMVAVVGEDGVNSYYGIAQDGSLEEIGGSVNGDDKTIVLSSGGELSLKNFGVKYYRYQAAEEGSPGEYIETPWDDSTYPAPDGLEVKVKKVSEGQYELTYYQPNPTTVEGLQSAISSLQSTVSNMYTKEDINQKFEEMPAWVELD